MRNTPGIPCLVPAVLAILAAFAPTRAEAAGEAVNAVRLGDDTVVGTIGAPGVVERIPFRSVTGTRVRVMLEVEKGSALVPSLVLLGTDRREDPAATAAMRSVRGGRAVLVPDYVCTANGFHYLEVRGTDGTTGAWRLTTKAKAPKAASGAGEVAGYGTAEFRFTCPGNAEGTISVKADRGSAARPAFVSFVDPLGRAIPLAQVSAAATGFTVRAVPMAEPGDYTLRVSSPAGAAGAFRVSVRWKAANRLPKRTIDASAVVDDPVVVSVDPDLATTDESPVFTVQVDFLRPGASVVLRSASTQYSVPASAVVVEGTSATFTLGLAAVRAGAYDVVVRNADGGEGALDRGLTVQNASPGFASVSPAFGYDDETVRVTVSGGYLLATGSASLTRGNETIQGTGLSGGGASLDVTFNLAGRARAAWDLVLASPGSVPSVHAGAFEIRKRPPTVASLSPNRSLDQSVVTSTILGARFEPGAAVSLRRGEATIDGTDVVLFSGGSVAATFDATGAAVGGWDVVVRNPDGLEGVLAGGFRVNGLEGPAVEVVLPSARADGPTAVVRNATLGEFLVAWIETDAAKASWDVRARRVGDDGSALGAVVTVSSSDASIPKRDLVAGLDPDHGEYLLAWSETRQATPEQADHPSGNGTTDFSQVFARRLAGADLAPEAAVVQVTPHESVSGWYLDEFQETRPSVAWDPDSALWSIAWMREFSTQGLGGYSYDDYDVLARTLDRGGDVLGTVVEVANGPLHEADPALAWDSVGRRVLVAYTARATSDYDPLDVVLGTPGSTAIVAAGMTNDLADPRLAVDTATGRIVVSWTRVPSGGARSVEALLASGMNFTALGSTVSMGGGGDENFLAVPVYNAADREASLVWTRIDSGGAASVRMHRLDPAASGLETVGSEMELSGGAGDEGAATCVAAGDLQDIAVFWLGGLEAGTDTLPVGSVMPQGPYRGTGVWMQRIR